MSIISKETFEKFTEEEKAKLRDDYDNLIYLSEHGTDEFLITEAPKTIKEYERLFGKENLSPKIKTWVDVLNQTDTHDFFINHSDCDNKLKLKLIATYKISKLIELGYGGIVTNEEWQDDNILKYYIKNNPHKSEPIICCTYHADEKRFISFHSQQQAEEFMSYPENRTLIEQYYLM